MEAPVEDGPLAMATNRLVDPGSKLSTYQWLEVVYAPEGEELQLSHLYRALDLLRENIRTVEEALFARSRDPFNLDVDLALFDTTSTYFEGQEYIVGIPLRKWRAANEVLKQGGSTK